LGGIQWAKLAGVAQQRRDDGSVDNQVVTVKEQGCGRDGAITQRTVLVRAASVDPAVVDAFRAFMEGSIGLGRVVAAGGCCKVVVPVWLAGKAA
jgi:hypothetical protein